MQASEWSESTRRPVIQFIYKLLCFGFRWTTRANVLQIFLNGTGVWDSTSSHFADSVCTGNEAGGRRSTGGCIALHDVVLEVDGGDLVGNSAHDQGGAVHVGPDAQLYVWDGDIWNNKARLGGAIVSPGVFIPLPQ